MIIVTTRGTTYTRHVDETSEDGRKRKTKEDGGGGGDTPFPRVREDTHTHRGMGGTHTQRHTHRDTRLLSGPHSPAHRRLSPTVPHRRPAHGH